MATAMLDEYPSYYEFFGRKIEPWQCDITTTGAAVIVHAVGTRATFNNRIAKRILEVAGEKAGPVIKEEVQRHTPLQPGSVIITHAGRSTPTHYLFHVVVSSAATRYAADPKLILEAVTRCVRLADLLNEPTMALPPLGTGKGRASSVKVVKQMVNVILDLLPKCERLNKIIFATTSKRTFALFNNRVLADIALARREEELRKALHDLPPSLYGLVGTVLERLERARSAGESPGQLLQEAEGLIKVGKELQENLPSSSGPMAGIAQLIVATGGSIIRNVTQQATTSAE